MEAVLPKKLDWVFSGDWGHFQAQVGRGWHCPTGLFWLGCSEWTTTRINSSLLILLGVSWVCMLASFETPGIGFGQVTRSKVSTWKGSRHSFWSVCLGKPTQQRHSEQIHRDLPQKISQINHWLIGGFLNWGCPNPKWDHFSIESHDFGIPHLKSFKPPVIRIFRMF